MNSLHLSIALVSGHATLRPVIDGVDMLAHYTNDQGLGLERLLPPLSSVLLPTRSERRVLIGCCSCGETGCGSLALRLRRRGSEVLWEPDERSRDESLSHADAFDLVEYLGDAVDRAAEDRPGEGQGSRVARRVRLMLGMYDQSYDSLTHFQAAKVDWISAWPWDSEVVKVSLTTALGQDVVEFHPTYQESDQAYAARVATAVNERRYGRSAGR